MNLQKLFCALLLAPTLALAVDTAYSPPVGGMTITVPAGQTRAVTLPLLPAAVGNGAVVGVISAVGSNYIDVANANWTPAAFSTASTPYLLRIKSGAAAGRVIPVSTTANTATRLFLTTDGFGLDQVVPPAAGDSFELLLADTLSSFFGSSTLQGGPDAASADNVQIWANTAWVYYYYNTTRSRWERSTDTAASAARDNQLLRQDRGFMILRRATSELKIYVTGSVPQSGPKHNLSRPGVTFFSLGLPAPITLGALSLQTNSPGWRSVSGSSNALSSADFIQIWSNTAWTYYYYDSGRGSWQRSTDTGASSSRDSITIPAGQPIMIRRLDSATAAADNFVAVPLPYTAQL